MKNVVLIGMPGCGKSTCGVLAAKALCKHFVDTDLVIQQNEKMPLQAILDQKGNYYFSAAEESAVCLLQADNAVVATGGSVVYSEKAMAHLKQNAVVIYLSISFQTMLERITNMGSRGILLPKGESVASMFEKRRVLYEKYADVTLRCDKNNVETTVCEIVNAVRERE